MYSRLHQCLRILDESGTLVASIILYDTINRTVKTADRAINQFPNYRFAALNVKQCAYVAGAFIFGRAKKYKNNIMINNMKCSNGRCFVHNSGRNLIAAEAPPCDMTAVDGDATKYTIMDNGNQVTMPCPIGTEFKQAQCICAAVYTGKIHAPCSTCRYYIRTCRPYSPFWLFIYISVCSFRNSG